MNGLIYNIHIMSSYVLGTDYQYYTVAELNNTVMTVL